MSFFLPSLKKSGHLNQIYVTICIVGSRKLKEFNEDYAERDGWGIFAPNLTIYGFDADPSACHEMNKDIKNRQLNWNEKHLPHAIWDSVGKATLYLTKYQPCSSLYPPSEEYLARFGGVDMYKVMSTLELETTTIDEVFWGSNGLNTDIDYLQIDVQGGELPVLEGSSRCLASVLATAVEVEFMQVYTNQPLFSDVDIHLSKKGFSLFDLVGMYHVHPQTLPFALSPQHPGRVLWGDAYYFRDLIRHDINMPLRTPERIFKLACIADVMNFHDYAMEVLVYLTLRYGDDKNYNFTDNILESIESLPEELKQQMLFLPVIQKLKERV